MFDWISNTPPIGGAVNMGGGTILVIIFWDFLMFYQIFLSPQVKRFVIISNRHGIYKLSNDLRLHRHEIPPPVPPPPQTNPGSTRTPPPLATTSGISKSPQVRLLIAWSSLSCLTAHISPRLQTGAYKLHALAIYPHPTFTAPRIGGACGIQSKICGGSFLQK